MKEAEEEEKLSRILVSLSAHDTYIGETVNNLPARSVEQLALETCCGLV